MLGSYGMFTEEGASLSEAEQEILNFTRANAKTGVRTTVKGIVEHFERKPYGLQDKLEALPEYPGLLDREKQTITAELENALATIDQARLIAVIREKVNSFKSTQYPGLLGRITAQKSKPTNEGNADGFGEEPISHPQTEYVQAADIKVVFNKTYLADETDVDAYVDRLRETLTKEVRAGKRIIV